MPYFLCTHTDLDGFGSSLVYNSLNIPEEDKKNIKRFNYDELDTLTQYLLANTQTNDIIFIVDLNYKNLDNIIEFKSKRPNIIYIDHHKYDDKYYEALPADFIIGDKNNSKSAALLFFDYIENEQKQDLMFNGSVCIDKLNLICNIISNYDTWAWAKTNDIQCKQLNELLYLKDKDDFAQDIYTFITQRNAELFSEFDKYLLDLEKKKKDKLFKKFSNNCKIHKDSTGNKYIYFQGKEFNSEFLNKILSDERYAGNIDYVVNYYNGSLQFRSVGDFDVATVAKAYGGGGHKNSSGCLIPEQFINNFKI